MPPNDYSEGGRDRHVRDVTAPNFSNPSAPVFVKFPTSTTVSSPITPSASPTGIDRHSLAVSNQNNPRYNHSAPLSSIDFKTHHALYSGRPNPTPLLTPCSSSDSLSLNSGLNTRHSTPAILNTIFPDGIQEDVQAIHDISTQLPNALKGAIVDRHSGIRSLYILGLTSSVTIDRQVRDIVVRVLDLADEEIEADQVFFALEKDHDSFRELLQGLLYVGGTVVKNAPHLAVNSRLILVGIEV